MSRLLICLVVLLGTADVAFSQNYPGGGCLTSCIDGCQALYPGANQWQQLNACVGLCADNCTPQKRCICDSGGCECVGPGGPMLAQSCGVQPIQTCSQPVQSCCQPAPVCCQPVQACCQPAPVYCQPVQSCCPAPCYGGGRYRRPGRRRGRRRCW